jgi:hypothetical protein
MPNRLAQESSPYLLQHADNPVDWYPWGQEAFDRARAEDKPIFVSIGYAACHWCHVMAHESFESEDIAARMNELFINVKVDREERPDVDAVYMNAIQVMGQGGGWPLSAFCTSDGTPYYLGTYFPPTDRHGRPGFPKLLEVLADVYRGQRDKVLQNTEGILDGLRQIDEHYRRAAIGGEVGRLDQGMLVAAGRQLAQKTDPHHGGFGGKPKFPSSSSQELLARTGRLSFGGPSREAFERQCQGMARGGIYDHLGGGFARYSVDERWLVPHFEKMLYDNAQLLAIYGDAYALLGTDEYARVVRETIGWLDREMTHATGALYASQDADSEGEEGTFYVWTPEQIRAVLGPADAIQFEAAYGVTAAGNFERGTTVLSRVTPLGSEFDEAALAEMREKLRLARAARVAPDTDTKVLAGWNGLAVAGLVRAWEATGQQRALAKALEVATFLRDPMVHDNRLWRVFKDGEVKLDGTLDDYAFVAHGFLALAEATGDPAWWDLGARLATAILERFYEEQDGVGIFYLTPIDDEGLLIHRPESHHDGAIPSGAAVAVEVLVRLGLVAGDARALEIAERYLAGRCPLAVEQPFASSRLLGALDLYLNGTEIVVTDGTGREPLLTAVRRAYAPTKIIAGAWAAPDLLAGKTPAPGGVARAYVCRGQTCSAPVTDPLALVGELSAVSVQRSA